VARNDQYTARLSKLGFRSCLVGAECEPEGFSEIIIIVSNIIIYISAPLLTYTGFILLNSRLHPITDDPLGYTQFQTTRKFPRHPLLLPILRSANRDTNQLLSGLSNAAIPPRTSIHRSAPENSAP
jgi:hypothetical protein